MLNPFLTKLATNVETKTSFNKRPLFLCVWSNTGLLNPFLAKLATNVETIFEKGNT